MTRGAVVARISTNARFRIDIEGVMPHSLPRDLCVKGYFGPEQWPFRFVGVSEALFYRDLAGRIPVRTLPAVYADIDAEAGHGVIITRDIAVDHAEFLDGLSPYTSDQVEASLEQYAILHSSTWGAGALSDVSWLTPPFAASSRIRGLDDILYNFEGPIGASVPQPARRAERLLAAFGELPNLTSSGPVCLLHGDAHVGNLYLDGDRRPCLLDWQIVQRGPWYFDVGYHIASALPPEDRRANERELLASYLARLSALGVVVPPWDDAWRQYVCGFVYGFYLWAITRKVRPEITAVLLERLGTAVADHDAFRLILG